MWKIIAYYPAEDRVVHASVPLATEHFHRFMATAEEVGAIVFTSPAGTPFPVWLLDRLAQCETIYHGHELVSAEG